jgi:ATP-binding cassette, subfamily B, bacterial
MPAARSATLSAAVRRIAALWRPHRWAGAGIFLLLVLQTVFTVVLALAVKAVIDDLTGDGGPVRIGPVLVALAAGFAVSSLAELAAGYLSARAGAQILADVRTAAFAHLQRLTIGFHDRSRPGDLLAHFSSDVANLSRGVIKKPLDALQSLAAIVFYLPVMALLDWRLTLAAAVTMPVAASLAHRLVPAPDGALDEEKRRIAAVLDEVDENLRAQAVIRAFGLRRRARERFDGTIGRLRTVSTRAEFGVALVAAASRYAVLFVQLVIVAAGAALALNGTIDAGTLAAFVALLNEFAWETIVIVSDAIPEITKAAAGIRRIDGLLAAGPVEEDAAEPTLLASVTGTLDLAGVAFSYDGAPAGRLDGIDLHIPAGNFVAIVGPSGSGKSTLLSLLPRFHDPTSGTIRLDGVDTRTVALERLRGAMGIVFQDTLLLRRSLRENISIAHPGVPDDELLATVARAGLSDLVGELPMGLDTLLGGDGIHPSGGQRQRIGIARALIRAPRVLLLDEVTAALDPAAEAAINDTIRAVRGERTVIAVTHRLRSITDADLIVVLEGGRIVERGRFDDLLAAGGPFSRMWEKQIGFTVRDDGRFATVTPERLRAIPLFAGLSDEHLTGLADILVSEHYAGDSYVFRQGDPADRFHVIARGVVEVIDAGSGTVIAHLEDGDFFGEMALLDGARRNADVKAVTPTLTLSLGRDGFHDLLAGSPATAESVRAVARTRAAADRD